MILRNYFKVNPTKYTNKNKIYGGGRKMKHTCRMVISLKSGLYVHVGSFNSIL
jgi:hypothetical protein